MNPFGQPDPMTVELPTTYTASVSYSAGPANYVYFDRTQVALGAAKVSDCALTVLATIVSKPAPDRIILDSGSKTLTNLVDHACVVDGHDATALEIAARGRTM
jgi:D-serine deaminase-like pyridoxal phosphate-dependent protein